MNKEEKSRVDYVDLDDMLICSGTFGIRSIYETSGCRTSEGAAGLCDH